MCSMLSSAARMMTLPKGARIAVGRDHARSSRMIKRAIVSGIVSAGGVVRDVRELPVPVTQFATRDARCDAGIQVIVSPLDQRSADIRFLDSDGLQIDKRAEEFPANERKRSGRSSWCRACHNAATARWRDANPEAVEAYNEARRVRG